MIHLQEKKDDDDFEAPESICQTFVIPSRKKIFLSPQTSIPSETFYFTFFLSIDLHSQTQTFNWRRPTNAKKNTKTKSRPSPPVSRRFVSQRVDFWVTFSCEIIIWYCWNLQLLQLTFWYIFDVAFLGWRYWMTTVSYPSPWLRSNHFCDFLTFILMLFLINTWKPQQLETLGNAKRRNNWRTSEITGQTLKRGTLDSKIKKFVLCIMLENVFKRLSSCKISSFKLEFASTVDFILVVYQVNVTFCHRLKDKNDKSSYLIFDLSLNMIRSLLSILSEHSNDGFASFCD